MYSVVTNTEIIMTANNKDLFKLYDLIQNGDARTVETFLSQCSSNINFILPCKGIGVLHLAVGIEPLEKSKKCTEIILKHGGDPNLRSEDGITPLHIAAIWGRLDNLKLLVGCGGDPSRRDADHHSVFDYAAREQQWEVYDYLHNVVDLQDDSLESPCAYSLDLEKVIVKTDHLVAEYGLLTDEKMNEVFKCRKSEMVREWCDKATLIVNKLYPTILSEKSFLEDESVPWQTDDFTQSNTKNPCIDETRNSYKSCFSRPITYAGTNISGIERLDRTKCTVDHNCTCLCHESYNGQSLNLHDKRISIYENFSLPCSPSNIIHKNYKTKSSLKICKELKNLSDRTGHLTKCDTRPLISNNDSNETDCKLNSVLAVVQNKTNEWLSNSSASGSVHSIKNSDIDHRKSSTSGVNSSFSGGSIALANVEEEYKYEDKQEDVVLIEKRLLVSSIVLPIEETESKSSNPEHTILTVASSLPASLEYDNNRLRVELIQLGFNPGPIDNKTRTLYLKKLHSLKRRPVTQNTPNKTYSIELEKSLRNDNWLKDLSSFMQLEEKVRADFASPGKRWREGTSKTSFTYLLLDPRVTNNLPAKAAQCSQHASWITFVNSIFYVGKGKRSRPYSHLYQALTLWKRDFKSSNDKKVQYILDIWSEKVGVICLHIFQNVIPAEAYTYEAAMIDVLGVNNLKNMKTGNYYGITASWPMKERRMFGLYLLYKAMLIFVSEGERQLRPDDID